MPDGREMILAILKEGDFFGEMAMFDSSLRSASIKTLTDVEVGAIRYADFLVLLEPTRASDVRWSSRSPTGCAPRTR